MTGHLLALLSSLHNPWAMGNQEGKQDSLRALQECAVLWRREQNTHFRVLHHQVRYKRTICCQRRVSSRHPSRVRSGEARLSPFHSVSTRCLSFARVLHKGVQKVVENWIVNGGLVQVHLSY